MLEFQLHTTTSSSALLSLATRLLNALVMVAALAATRRRAAGLAILVIETAAQSLGLEHLGVFSVSMIHDLVCLNWLTWRRVFDGLP
jgi:hypothetical protein